MTGATAGFRRWTPVEDAAIFRGYRKGAARSIAAELGRTADAVRERASVLGVCAERRWTAAEEKLLRDQWGERSLRSFAKRLRRSKDAVYLRARQLGIVGEERAGGETVKQASKRTGFCPKKLVEILRAHDAVQLSTTRFTTKYTARPYYRLDPFDVDNAVAAYLKREKFGAAARRLGIAKLTLANALKKIGVTKPDLPWRHHWWIDEKTIERAIEARRAAHACAPARTCATGSHS